MTSYVVALCLLFVALIAIVLRKTYQAIPVKELKRRSGYGDDAADRLYRVARYGGSAGLLLWTVTGLTTALGIVLLSRSAPMWVSIIASTLYLIVAYEIVPAGRQTVVGYRLALLFSPFLAQALDFLYPVSERITRRLPVHHAPLHSGMYERNDLFDVIALQRQQADSRFSEAELDRAERALTFGDYRVHDVCTPLDQVKTVTEEETVGPILIDELHRLGQPFALVQDESGDITGSLHVHSLGIASSGKVRDIMDRQLAFLHEDDALTSALYGLLVAKASVFVVLSTNNKAVGIITIEAVLEQLIGPLPETDILDYTDRMAVMARVQHQSEPLLADASTVDPDESVHDAEIAAVEE